MHYAFASRTDPGRVRTHNEDALLVDEARGLAVLADGMGATTPAKSPARC